MYEAQQAYFYGLPENLALLSVTSNAAKVIGMGHRIGYLEKGEFPDCFDDAYSNSFLSFRIRCWYERSFCRNFKTTNQGSQDLVVWDSHPLALGATPVQVFIDGILQLQSPHIVDKPDTFQKIPKVPNFDEEARQAVEYEGLQPLSPAKTFHNATVIFKNVKSIHHVNYKSMEELQTSADNLGSTTVVTRNGSIVCHGTDEECMEYSLDDTMMKVVDLEGGSISPGLVSFGYPLGLVNIQMEPSTNDGSVHDTLLQTIPKFFGGSSSIIRAIDGLQFGTRNALYVLHSINDIRFLMHF